MSFTFSNTQSHTFSYADAKHIASKVATDLKRMQRLYGAPADSHIADYEQELIALLIKGYLNNMTYGYKRGDKWIVPTLRYTAKDLAGMLAADDDPGRVPAGADVSGAAFYSFSESTPAWWQLTPQQRTEFEKTLPFVRGNGSQPGLDGYMSSDKSYSAGGKSLDRSTLKKY